MIKQIAGRAGRRSSRYPNGEVTCYKGEDMVHLRAGLNTPTQRLVRCVVGRGVVCLLGLAWPGPVLCA